MTKARKLGVSTPSLYAVDPMLNTLTFEFVEGPLVKDILLDFGLQGNVEELLDDIAAQIGDAIGKLHDGGLIHGDFTTSNMLIQISSNQLVFVDFGLSFTSTLPEDKAVDLYVLERALLSMHSSCGNVMEKILNAYRKSSKQWSSTLNNETKRNKANDGWVNFVRREPLSSPCYKIFYPRGLDLKTMHAIAVLYSDCGPELFVYLYSLCELGVSVFAHSKDLWTGEAMRTYRIVVLVLW